MKSPQQQRPWLPYVIAPVGILASFLVWYITKYHIWSQIGVIPTIQSHHPWITLILGILISILIAVLVNVAQLARYHATELKKTNEDLKKEIAERMLAQETQQKLEVALLQGQKLQAVGTLAGGIAHDFNNILYAIIGYTELLREDVEKNSLAYNNLSKILEAAHRGQELVARILAFGRRQQHQFSVIHLKETIDAVLGLLKSTIPASVGIEFESTTEASVFGNQTQLHQVLVNIINNAVDSMDDEGNISIKLSYLPMGDPFLKQFPKTEGKNYCKIEISDTGHGIDQSTMKRIFEPFFTTKEVGKGTGLGLSIAHSIIKEHHGEIIVTSQIGKGTVFTIILPEHNH